MEAFHSTPYPPPPLLHNQQFVLRVQANASNIWHLAFTRVRNFKPMKQTTQYIGGKYRDLSGITSVNNLVWLLFVLTFKQHYNLLNYKCIKQM